VTSPPGSTTEARVFPPPPDPGAGAPRWYRRRAVLVALGVVVVVGAAVLSDLPTPTSRASDAQGESSVISEINQDIAPCVFSVREALTLYADSTGTLSTANRAQIPGLLRDDQNACSYTDANIFDLSDIEVPSSAAGKQVAQAANTVTVWATSDALGAIEAVQALTSHQSVAKARAELHTDERLLAADRDKATGEIDAAGRLLRTTLPALDVSKEVLPGVARS